MEEVGHSRLLKFLLPASNISNNMSEQYEIKFQYINPSNIESEVPEQQTFREVDLNQATTENDDNEPSYDEGIRVMEESTLVPVMTVTKQEAEFTKGDIKLQKVSVTENISDEENVAYENPAYSLVHSEVIENQPMRMVPGHQDSADSSKEDKDQAEPKKIKTRIPKFKQTVEKVKKEKKETDEKKEGEKMEVEVLPTQKRRSSIPKLNKTSKIPSAKEPSSKKEPNASSPSDKNDNKAEKTKTKTVLRGIPLPVKDKNVKKHTETPVPVKDIVKSKETNFVEGANIEEDTKDATQHIIKDSDIIPQIVNKSKEEISPDELNSTDIIVTEENKEEDEFDNMYDEQPKTEEDTTDSTPSVKNYSDKTPVVNKSNEEKTLDETNSTDIIDTGENEEQDEFDKIYQEQSKIEKDTTDATLSVKNLTDITSPIVIKSNEEIPSEEFISSDIIVTEENKEEDEFDKMYGNQTKTEEDTTDSTPSVKNNSDKTPVVNKSNEEIISEETNATDITVTRENEEQDEFDKMYDEIFDTKQTEASNEENLTFEDLESVSSPKLEMRFEEMIHAYDENNEQPTTSTEKVKFTKPFVKQTSLQEIVIPRQVPRRLSLEDVSNDNDGIFQNTTTGVRDEKGLIDMNDSTINTMEEQDVEHHSMMYTVSVQEKAQYEIMAQLHEKDEDDNDSQLIEIYNIKEPQISIQNNSETTENEYAYLDVTVPVSDKDSTIDHESEKTNVIQQEIKETVRVATPDIRDENINQDNDISPQLNENDNIQELTKHDTNYSNMNKIEEHNIEQHSMVYTNESAQFEIMTVLPKNKDDNDTQLEEINHIQEPPISIQNDRELTEKKPTDFNLIAQHLNENEPFSGKDETLEHEPEETKIIQQELNKTVKVATLEVNDKEAIQDNTQIREFNNNQDSVMGILNANYSNANRIEEQNIEQHSMIYTNEPNQFEIQLPEKEDAINTQLVEVDNIKEPSISIPNDSELTDNEAMNLNINPQKLNENVPIPDKYETTEYEPEETNTIQQELKETKKVVIPTFNDDSFRQDNDIKTQFREDSNIQEPTMKIEDTNDSNFNRIEEQNIEHHSMIYTNEPDKFELMTQFPEKELVDINIPPREVESIQEPPISIQKDNKLTENEVTVSIILQQLNENVPVPDRDETTDHEPEETNIVQQEAKGSEKVVTPDFKDDNFNQVDDNKTQYREVDNNQENTMKIEDTNDSNCNRIEEQNIEHHSMIYTNEPDQFEIMTQFPEKELVDINIPPKKVDSIQEPPISIQKDTEVIENEATNLHLIPQQSSETTPIPDKDGTTEPKPTLKDKRPEHEPEDTKVIQDKSKETVKVATPIFKDDNINKEINAGDDMAGTKYTDHDKPRLENQKSNSEVPDSSQMVLNMMSLIRSNLDNKNASDLDKPEVLVEKEVPDSQSLLVHEDSTINKIDSNQENIQIPQLESPNEIPKKKPVQSKIAVLAGDKGIGQKEKAIKSPATALLTTTTKKLQPDTKTKVKPPAVHKTEQTQKKSLDTDNIKHAERNKHQPHSKFKSKNNTNMEDLPQHKESNAANSEIEDVMKNNSTSDNILPAVMNDDKNKETNDTIPKYVRGDIDNQETSMVRGKVSRIISRLGSQDESKKTPKKVLVNEIPKKKSVSTRIAMFEDFKRKLTPVNMDAATEAKSSADSRTNKKLLTTKETLTEEAYNERVSELLNAKIKYGRMDKMVCIPLRDGTEMPALAVGTALLNPHLVHHVIGAALDLGYRSIDTAYIYGNEREVGEAIRAKIDDGTVTREELFITSKLWSTFHRQDLVEKACKASLTAMGLEYFDLYLIHNPMSFKEGGDPLPRIANVLQYSENDYMDAWYGMERLITKGLVKNIGVSNFNSAQVSRVYEKGRVKPVVNQVECHPYLSQQRLEQSCSEREVRLSCFGVLGSKGTPEELKSHQSPVIDDPLVKVMAAGLNVTPAQLLVRYQIESGHSVVVKSSTAAHLWDNLQAMAFNISSIELDALNALNRNKRTYTFKGMGDTHRNYPFKAPY